jgi:hypothetical protein
VFRAVATILVVAALSVFGSASALHVHVYADHDHPDHHHGPAAHSHVTTHQHGVHPDVHGAVEGVDESSARIESCDPAAHSTPVVFTCVSAHAPNPPLVSATVTVPLAPPVQRWRRVTPSDVRAHSPPGLTDSPLRAPPLVQPA